VRVRINKRVDLVWAWECGWVGEGGGAGEGLSRGSQNSISMDREGEKGGVLCTKLAECTQLLGNH
jgi:hypothetical protein